MSIQAVAWALEQDLPARPKLVLVAIANHANHVDGYCWLRAETIAHEAACGERSIYRFISALERNGFLRREQRRAKDGKRRSNNYWLLLDRPMAGLWSWRGVNGYEDELEDDTISSSGENAPTAIPSGGEVSEIDAGVIEPPAIAVTTKDSVEPSKINLESGRKKVTEIVRRNYKAPIQEVEKPKEIVGIENKRFVIQGTRAWDAWIDYRRSIGRPINGGYAGDGPYKGKTGRWLPSLFPPGYELLEHADSSDEAWQARNSSQKGLQSDSEAN